MRTGGTHTNLDVTPGGRARGCSPEGSKPILFKHKHDAYQIEGYEKQNTVVQKFCPGGMSGGHQRSKSRILGPIFRLSPNSS